MSEVDEKLSDINVFFASTVYYPLFGGENVRLHRYFSRLGERGVKVRVFTQIPSDDFVSRIGYMPKGTETNGDQRLGATAELPAFEVMNGIPVERTRVASGWRNTPAFFRQVAQYFSRHRTDIDVAFVHPPSTWVIPLLMRIRRMGIPTVSQHVMFGRFSTNRIRRALQRLDRRLRFNAFDCVVVISSAMARQLEEIGVSTRIEVIPPGVDLQRFRPVESESEKKRLRRELGLNPDSEIMLSVGGIVPRKGTDALVKAFALIAQERPEAHLVLVGPRQDLSREEFRGFQRQLQTTISAANVSDRVHFTGSVSNVEDYMRAADMFVFPSRREGFGNVVAEAMACAIPVVVTPFLGLPREFGVPGTHYVLSDWEPATLGSDIRALLIDPEGSRRMAQEGRRWAEQTLDVNQTLDRYATVCRELANGSG